MAYRLRNPVTGAEFNVSSSRRRDRFLRRGFTLAADPEAAKLSYRDVQAKAKALGIPANQPRAELERILAANEG